MAFNTARGRAAALWVFCAVVLGLCAPAEAAITRSGILHATVIDNFRTGQSTTRYSLRSGGAETVVRPTELAAEPGDRVAVTGVMRDGRLVGEVEATAEGPQTSAVTPGPRKVGVLLITFPGESAAPWSPGESRSEVFTDALSVNTFFEEESYGGISLTGKLDANGDVFGWFPINGATAGCPYTTWKNEADAAATANGVDLSGYQHLIYQFSYQSSCSWLGIAGLSANWSMINGNLFGVRRQVTIHELGHNLGLLHAGSWSCTSGATRVPISDTCTTTEYGDPFDAMGNMPSRHNNGWNLAKLGILTPENVQTVGASGSYAIRSALNPTTEPTVLRIPRTRTLNGSVNSWYYLEVRERGGVFENVMDASTTGVSIRATAAGTSPETLLLDATPSTSSFHDAPLASSKTFDGGPVRVTTLAAGGGGATVSVTLDEEPPTAPTALAATAGVERVQLEWGASSDNFGVHRYVVFRDGSQLGVTQSTSFLDPDASLGDHTYVVYAEDMTGNRSAGSAPATVSVVPDEESPTTPTGLTATAGAEGVLLQWSPSADDFGVDHYVVFRDGSQAGTAAGTNFLDSTTSAGSHSYVVYAQDETGNRSDASNPAIATLAAIEGPACAGGTCTVTAWHSGAPTTWTVPPGVGTAAFTVEGAQGGRDEQSSGFFDRGARVVATLGSLTAGQNVSLAVGGLGEADADGGEGGFGGGGDGTRGAGGGGYSSVEIGSALMLLAGGGGGHGLEGLNAVSGEEPSGGRGGQGGQIGTVGSPGVSTQAHGATLGRGNGGAAGGSGGSGGSGGAVTGASACPGGAVAGASGAAGSSLEGGGGAAGAGGGGGGGYVGGGQGGGGARDECGSTAGAGGGGGGSSFSAPGLSATFAGGIRRGYGRVTIAYPNPVTAADRSYLTAPDQELVVPAASGVLAGSSGVQVSASVVTPPAHGSLTLDDDGSFTYLPAAGYFGGDSFTYEAADLSGHQATGDVALTVALPPLASISAPSAGGTYTAGQLVPTIFSCSEGAGGTGLLSCNDSSGAKTASGGAGHLDTSTLGLHAYTVSAVSKDGLTGNASIIYTVVPAPEPPDEPQEPPDAPQDPPQGPGEPPGGEEPILKLNLSLGAGGKSLRELLRIRMLVIGARVNEAATVALTGVAELPVPLRRGTRKKFVSLFERETISFAAPGKQTVALVLSRKGRKALRRLPSLRLAIVGKATDATGGTAMRRVALSLRR